jgi:hypothetical protein
MDARRPASIRPRAEPPERSAEAVSATREPDETKARAKPDTGRVSLAIPRPEALKIIGKAASYGGR